MGTRRKHSKEFKLEAVRLATQPGASVKETAANLGLHPSQITAWKRELATHAEQAFPGNGRLRPDDEEIRRLKLENKRLREERDILKKATLFFAQEGRRR
jgi:transposase